MALDEYDSTGRKTIGSRYNEFCDRQKDKEFLWYSLSFITLIGSIMPISLMTMFSTPYFYPFVFLSMLLFFGNILVVIGRTSIKFIISFYLITVCLNILIPVFTVLALRIFA